MDIPDKYKKPDMATVLKIQNSMCSYEIDTTGCKGISCKKCPLNLPLPEFSEWLTKTLEKANE